jgi:L,D-peptidoglycan transpeptidase YkuD (ErfK/YbiS/YcfS/YnhG family)
VSVRLGVIFALTALLCACASMTRAPRELPWSTARQLVLVVTPDWNSPRGELRTYARVGREWQSASTPVAVVVGRNGAAWGLGLHSPQTDGPTKHEGDGRSPAGVFAIGTAFGYAPAENMALPYRALAADDYCVDVSTSPLYNRIVAAHDVGAAAVTGSTEPMRRDIHFDGDDAYKVGFVIAHNPNGAPGGGSCIFAHLWKSADSATSGCTAMAEPVLRELLRWLQPQQRPVFVLLPDAAYRRLRADWQLPDIAENR